VFLVFFHTFLFVTMETSRLSQISHKILVLSGKGGVGKSLVSSQLAISLVKAGKKVGLLDIDICGPSIPRILGLENQRLKTCSEGWVPVYTDSSQNLAVMSIAFLLPDDTSAVVWRGPKKSAMIKQFLEDVLWQHLDYLIIDTPPGTSDEHLSIIENLQQYNPDGAVIVTTPQEVSLSDVRKEITFCRKIGLPIIGVIENMSGFICPHCEECTNIFSSEGGKLLAEEQKVSFIGKIPIDPSLGTACETGTDIVSKFPDSPALQTITNFVKELIKQPTNEVAKE